MSRRSSKAKRPRGGFAVDRLAKELDRLRVYLESMTPEQREEFTSVVEGGVEAVARERTKRRRDMLLVALALRSRCNTS